MQSSGEVPFLEMMTSGEEETQALAKKILEACLGRKIFAIYGDLGAGKTTLIQGLCRELGTEDSVKSPTFSIVNEYEYPGGRIFHFDFYRIESVEEAYDLGYEEYFDSGDYCFIEWPEMIEGLVPEDCVRIRITAPDVMTRSIQLYLD